MKDTEEMMQKSHVTVLVIIPRCIPRNIVFGEAVVALQLFGFVNSLACRASLNIFSVKQVRCPDVIQPL